MKPNLLLFSALLLVTALLFLNLPDDPAATPAAVTNVQREPSPQGDMALKDISAQMEQMRRDYSALLHETALLRARMEQAQAANRHAGLAAPAAGEEATSPGVTIYLDTSGLPVTGKPGQEWTAVGFHDAGQAPDGSNQAVVSISKITRPQPLGDEPIRAVPVSRWQ